MVLLDVALGGSRHGKAVESVARRRGLTPEYIEDRAKVLLGSAEEAGRRDAYRVLGLPPLASGDSIRDRWRKLAREFHPDTRGDDAGLRRFLSIKQAYDTLSDPVKRQAYEEEWKRTVGVVEEARIALAASGAEKMWSKWLSRVPPARERDAGAEEVKEPSLESLADQQWRLVTAELRSVVGRWHALEKRLAEGLGRESHNRFDKGVPGLLEMARVLREALATFTLDELDGVEREVSTILPSLERAHKGLVALQELKSIASERAA